MIDEVYVSKKVNLVNGKLVGLAVDENVPAGTILCFMIKSFSSKFKDVVSLFPISTDNHTANKSFYKLLSGGNEVNQEITHPYAENRKLFLMYDSVHNFKNIFNNLLKAQEFRLPYLLGLCDQPIWAKYSNVMNLCEIEKDKPLKIAYKINKSILNPTGIQRVSAKFSFAVFHESTIHGLKQYGFCD